MPKKFHIVHGLGGQLNFKLAHLKYLKNKSSFGCFGKKYEFVLKK
jgi:hypothetical protein